MTHSWTIIDTGRTSAAKNMAIDEELLANLSQDSSTPILHLYDWEGSSATYGHFIDPSKLLCLDAAKSYNLQLARRPTGGGLIFHLTDWAFSVLVPAGHPAYSVNTLDNYAFVNNLVMHVVGLFVGANSAMSLLPSEEEVQGNARHFCMAKPTRYDVMLHGRKVGGGAQRRTRTGFLHQGTISLAFPDEGMLDGLLLPGCGVMEAMKRNTCALLPDGSGASEIKEAREHLSKIFQSML